ncbi:hypothetical protein D3C81_1430860 [compost metagenome]
MELRDRDHRGIDGALVAGNDPLQRRDDLRGGEDRVVAIVRHGRMRALAAHDDAEFIARCHQRAHARAESADRHAGPVVHAEHRIAGETREQPVLDHFARAAAAFLGRLEEQVNGAIEGLVLRKVVRRAEQHRGMPVVAACMHLARMLRAMAEGVGLLQRQGVHVGAQADGARAAAVADHPDKPGGAEAAMHFDAPRLEVARDHVGRALFFEAEFRMGVDIAADRADFGLRLQDFGDELHDAGVWAWRAG